LQKKTPAPEGPGSVRRMGEGLGGWGARHPALAVQLPAGRSVPPPPKIIFEPDAAPAAAAGARVALVPTAGPRAGHPGTPNSVNGYKAFLGHHCGLRPRSGCRPEIGWEVGVAAHSLGSSATAPVPPISDLDDSSSAPVTCVLFAVDGCGKAPACHSGDRARRGSPETHTPSAASSAGRWLWVPGSPRDPLPSLPRLRGRVGRGFVRRGMTPHVIEILNSPPTDRSHYPAPMPGARFRGGRRGAG
jgi:hypothetical protein